MGSWAKIVHQIDLFEQRAEWSTPGSRPNSLYSSAEFEPPLLFMRHQATDSKLLLHGPKNRRKPPRKAVSCVEKFGLRMDNHLLSFAYVKK